MLVHWLHNRSHVHSRRLISFQTVLCYFRFDVLWNAEVFSVLCNYATCNTPGFSFSLLLRNELKSGNVTCNRDFRNTSLSRPGDIFSLSYLESCTEETPSNCCSWQNRVNALYECTSNSWIVEQISAVHSARIKQVLVHWSSK